jgi:hypothetical protein
LSTLTAGTGVSIANAAGGITIAATADTSTKVSKTGDTMTGALTMPLNGLIAGTSQLVLANGNVGIGTTAPTVKLSVSGGQIAGTYLASSNGTVGSPINWNSGNIQKSDVAAGNLYMDPATMVDGAAYTLVLNNATGGSYTLSASGMTFKCNPACPIVVTGGKDTIVTMIKAGTSGWVSWVKDFQ